MKFCKFPLGSIVTSSKTGVLTRFDPRSRKCTINREDGSSFEEYESRCTLSKEDEFYGGYAEIEFHPETEKVRLFKGGIM